MVLLIASGALFYLVVVTQWSMVEAKVPLTLTKILSAGLLLIFSYSFYTFITLTIRNLQSRFVQTLTCLFATHTIIHIFAYPLLAVTPLLIDGEAIPQAFDFIFMFVYLLLTIIVTVWQLMVTVHIYKAALKVDNLPAILATIGLFAANILIVSIIR
jgi:hypothetical protein